MIEKENTMMASHTDEISLKELSIKIRDWVKYLLSKWYILLLASFIGGTIGFFYAKSKRPLYTAMTTFVLEGGESGGGFGQYAGIAAMAGIDLANDNGGIFHGDNLLELYKSRKMIEAALLTVSESDSSLLLINRYLKMIYLDSLDTNISQNFDFKGVTYGFRNRMIDSIIQKVVVDINRNNLIVGRVDKKLSIFKIEVKTFDEVFSKEFNEALVSEVNDFYVRTKTKKSIDNIKILQHKTDSVRAVINGDIVKIATIVDATPHLNSTRQGQRIGPTQKSQFSAETNKAILGQLVQNLEITKMSLMKETPLIEVLDNPRYPVSKETFSVFNYSVMGLCLFTIFCIFFLSIYWWVIKVL